MVALIIAWSTTGPQWPGIYAADAETVRRTGIIRRHWPLPGPPVAPVGADVWLLIAHGGPAMQGIAGHGVVAGVSPGTSDGQGIDVDFDLLVQHGDQIPSSLLENTVQGFLTSAAASGLLDDRQAAGLRSLWAASVVPAQGAVHPPPGVLPPHLTRRLIVNRSEYDDDLRRTALAHRGSACHACGLDMESTYGEHGRDLVALHHTTPLAHLTDRYDVDPTADLVPLCPNCHVVAHSRWPVSYGVEELRTMLRSGGHLRGEIVTDEQLAAEAAAERLLRADGTPGT
ncbi:HNH endonuclease [Arthrobacter sp. N1]|uniref:HNH endonuclease n=1 Tax=Arthrobacter sp. N1 TaxID=619291 RepID=UPI003BAEE2A1